MKLGRNQIIGVVGTLVLIGAGFGAALAVEPDKLQPALDYIASIGKWGLGFIVGGSAVIKAAGAIRNGGRPPEG